MSGHYVYVRRLQPVACLMIKAEHLAGTMRDVVEGGDCGPCGADPP